LGRQSAQSTASRDPFALHKSRSLSNSLVNDAFLSQSRPDCGPLQPCRCDDLSDNDCFYYRSWVYSHWRHRDVHPGCDHNDRIQRYRIRRRERYRWYHCRTGLSRSQQYEVCTPAAEIPLNVAFLLKWRPRFLRRYHPPSHKSCLRVLPH
jgi:hypothetical protein